MARFHVRRFVARVKALPLTIGNIPRAVAGTVPLYEEVVGQLTLTASHQHMPAFGNVYAITIYEEGPGAGHERRMMRAALSRELGEPKVEETFPEKWMLYFMSDDQSIPRTNVHRRLGDRRMAELCHDLSVEERLVIDEALAAMEATVGKPDLKLTVTLSILSRLPANRIIEVNQTLLTIILEFGARRPK